MSHVTLRDIFTDEYDTYCKRFGETPLNNKIAEAICTCRTEHLGGHLYQCPHCNDTVPLYNSCNNRHCPRCQAQARREWVDARKEELLPVPYFHVVFTIPSELNPFALRNKKVFYSIMFKAVNETMQQLAATSKYLGASIGFIAVLHTWGQNLMDHPHVHCIVPAGGLSRSGTKWIPCKNFFLFPFSVMRELFRAKVLDYVKKAIADGSISLCGHLEYYNDKHMLKKLFAKLYKMKWVIFAKQSFASPLRVIQYLGNYTHRIAISESRLINYTDTTVCFKYKDYADDDKQKVMTLDTTEFIRRFLLHVLPDRFMRIRHFGFLSNANRKRCRERLTKIFTTLKPETTATKESKKIPWNQRILEKTGTDPLLCKKCLQAVLVKTMILQPVGKKECECISTS
jgi:hypothetical protein